MRAAYHRVAIRKRRRLTAHFTVTPEMVISGVTLPRPAVACAAIATHSDMTQEHCFGQLGLQRHSVSLQLLPQSVEVAALIHAGIARSKKVYLVADGAV